MNVLRQFSIAVTAALLALASLAAPAGAQVLRTQTLTVPDYAALEALPFALFPDGHTVIVAEAGRGGAFVKVTTDISAIVTADSGKCVVIPSPQDLDGSSGGWVRREWRSGVKAVHVEWCMAFSGFNTVTAFNSAQATIASVGGGKIVFSAGKTYSLNASLNAIPSNTVIETNDATFLGAAAATLNVFSITGSGEGTGRTLNADVAAYDDKIVLTSGTIATPTAFAEGDEVRIVFTDPTHGAITHVTTVRYVAGNTLYLAKPVPFAVATSATYTIHKVNGWVRNVAIRGRPTFDGSSMAANAGMFGIVINGAVNIDIDGWVSDEVSGGGSVIQATPLLASNCRDLSIGRVSDNLSGSAGYGSSDIRSCSEVYVSYLNAQNIVGFGPYFGAGTSYVIDTLKATGAIYRNVKFSNVNGLRINYLETGNAEIAGVVFSESNQNVSVGTAIIESSGVYDKKPVGTAVRASNVVTMTTPYKHRLEVGRLIELQNMTTSSFNTPSGATIATVPDDFTVTYAQTGANETATVGSGVWFQGYAASMWFNASDNEVDIETLIVRGPSNSTYGDVQIDASNLVTFGRIISDDALEISGTGVEGVDYILPQEGSPSSLTPQATIAPAAAGSLRIGSWGNADGGSLGVSSYCLNAYFDNVVPQYEYQTTNGSIGATCVRFGWTDLNTISFDSAGPGTAGAAITFTTLGKLKPAPASGKTALYLLIDKGSGDVLTEVEVCATDSAGTGKRALCIPN